MEKLDFLDETIDLLCLYGGDDRVFEALIKRWGIEETFDIVSALVDKKTKVAQMQEEADEQSVSIDEVEIEEPVGG